VEIIWAQQSGAMFYAIIINNLGGNAFKNLGPPTLLQMAQKETQSRH